MMHSQHTDFLSSSLSIEPALQLMFAASTEARGGVECVSVHSLSAERGKGEGDEGRDGEWGELVETGEGGT